MSYENVEGNSSRKKVKLDIKEGDDSSTADFFLDFNVVKILCENAKQKSLFVHGRFGDSADDAVLLLEKTPFCSSSVSELLRNNVTVEASMKNDIYKALQLYPTVPYSGKYLFPLLASICTECREGIICESAKVRKLRRTKCEIKKKTAKERTKVCIKCQCVTIIHKGNVLAHN